MTTCLFCREELVGLICAHCHARELPEMAVWHDDDDSRAQRGEETRLERLLRESVARAAELRRK